MEVDWTPAVSHRGVTVDSGRELGDMERIAQEEFERSRPWFIESSCNA